jgi:ABC-type Fe3+-siderophore transport system permease subunit
MAQRITRDDLEGKFRAVQDSLQGKVDDQKQTLTTAAIVGGVLVLLLVYVIGRRTGRRKTSIVEIRRS